VEATNLDPSRAKRSSTRITISFSNVTQLQNSRRYYRRSTGTGDLQAQAILQAIYRHRRYYRRSTDTGDTTGDARRDTTGDARRDTTRDTTRDARRDTTGDATGDATDDTTDDTTHDATVTDDTTDIGDLQAQAIYRHR
jgi:hypothetical protein